MADDKKDDLLAQMNEQLDAFLGTPEYKPWLEETVAIKAAREGNIEEATARFKKLAEDNWGEYGTMTTEQVEKVVVDLSNETSRILSFFKNMFSQVWNDLKTLIMGIFNDVLPWIAENVFQLTDDNFQKMLLGYEDIGFLDPTGRKTLMDIKHQFGGAGWIAHISLALQMFVSYVGILQSTMGGKATQNLQAQFRGNLPNPNDVLRAAFIAPEKGEEVKNLFARAGLSDKDQELMLIANYAAYPVDQVRECFLRKILTKEKAEERLMELGFTPARIQEIMATWEIIPGPQDILWMVGKEAFEDEQVRMFGLDEEFPSEVAPWLNKQGLSDYWQQKYWRAHWDAPSIQQGYDLLHRNLIDEEQLDLLFRVVEIPTFWREKMMKASYYPYTRVDARRMFREGVIDEKEVYRTYLDLGYNEEKALNLTIYAIKEKEASNKELTRSQIEAGYKQGVMTRDEAKTLLMDITYPEAEAEYVLTMAEAKEEESYRNAVQAIIKQRFLNDIIDENGLREELNKLGIPARNIRQLTEQYQFLKVPVRAYPSKTDLDKFYRGKIINRSDYTDGLKQLGYQGKHVTWYASAVERSAGFTEGQGWTK